MKSTIYLPFALGLILSFNAPSQAANTELKATLFDATKALIEKAEDGQADLLSPENYEKAIERYKRAEWAFQQGKRLEDIRKDLNEVGRRLEAALETSRLGKIAFSPALKARAQANVADASRLSAKLWREAEAAFADAAKELESGNVKNAKKRTDGVVHRYRKAEIDALKAHYLSDARNLLHHAEALDAEKYAPTTLHQARRFAQLVEAKLGRPDYDKEEIERLSRQAKQTAQRATRLAQEIHRLRDEQHLEVFVLHWEDRLVNIAEAADIASAVASDRDELADQIVEKLRFYRSQIRELDAQLSQRDARVQHLQANLGRAEGKLEAQAETRERVASVAQLFQEDEARVLRNGEQIVIRLYGLHFRTGRTTIEPEYFYLLGKVQEAIALFPEADVTIEGHTDSYGDEAQNRALSEKRASAVLDYILANTARPAQIKAVGLGEENPIATNDTPEGRAKNRRIDVVLHLNAAQPPVGVVF